MSARPRPRTSGAEAAGIGRDNTFRFPPRKLASCAREALFRHRCTTTTTERAQERQSRPPPPPPGVTTVRQGPSTRDVAKIKFGLFEVFPCVSKLALAVSAFGSSFADVICRCSPAPKRARALRLGPKNGRGRSTYLGRVRCAPSLSRSTMQAASVVCPRVILKSGQVHSAVRAQQSSEVGRQAEDASQANYLQIETWIALGVNDLRVRARAARNRRMRGS